MGVVAHPKCVVNGHPVEIHAVPEDELYALNDLWGRRKAVLPIDGSNGEIGSSARDNHARRCRHELDIVGATEIVHVWANGGELRA